MNKTRTEAVGRKVRSFYEAYSYPGYEGFESPLDLLEKARRGLYAKLLDEELPLGARVLEAGCGTGQLASFLSLVQRKVLGIDFSYNSLREGNGFKKTFALHNVSFAQMDLFSPALKDESFDYVFCNGVLHHTADAQRAFENLCRLVKPGGYITVGLYNTYGRLLLDLRRWIFYFTGDKLKRLDFYLRQRSLGGGKGHIWFMDQYKHPHEEKFSVGDVLDWFQSNNIEYINSIPKIRFREQFLTEDRLFELHDLGNRLDLLLSQIVWIFSQSREGGFFITIGRKCNKS